MQQTLFLIPQSWLEGPLLIGWLVLGLIIFGWFVWRHGLGSESYSFLPIYGVIAAAIYFLAPRIGITDINPADPIGPEIKVGLAIRGYGFFMLLGLICGAGLAMFRAKREGIDPDHVISLAFWMAVCGIIGARLFYVIQKRDQFTAPFPEVIGDWLNMTQGGLVVYGSLIGATIGGAIYLMRSGLPALKMADIAAPGMVLGLALGRIGCLMNGCCFGGVCDVPQIAQQFPAGAPPYSRQLETGELIGIRPVEGNAVKDAPPRPIPAMKYIAESVEPDSIADKAGIKAGQWFAVFEEDERYGLLDKDLRAVKAGHEAGQRVYLTDGETVTPIYMKDLPDYSIGVYPTQVLATINALLLTALLWFFFPFRKRDGQVFALLLILYSITRFLLELIRRDEYGQFGTTLTISQWVSVLAILGGFVLFAMAPPRTDANDGGTPTATSAT